MALLTNICFDCTIVIVKHTEDGMRLNKEQTILKEIICKHLPRFYGKENEVVTNWEDYNVERLVEKAMAELGDYEHVDAYYYDFSDFSD